MALKKVSGVYAIINTVTGKRYIGSTKDATRRWRRHREMLRLGKHHSFKLQASWNKHGEAVWRWEMLEECSEKDLLIREQHYLDVFDVFHSGYNTSASSSSVQLSDDGKRKVTAGGAKGATAVSGSRWMHHELYGTKRVLKLDIPAYLTEGWIFGRDALLGKPSPNKGNHYSRQSIERLRRSHVGLRWMTHPAHGNLRVRDENTSDYLNSGWRIGRVLSSDHLKACMENFHGH